MFLAHSGQFLAELVFWYQIQIWSAMVISLSQVTKSVGCTWEKWWGYQKGAAVVQALKLCLRMLSVFFQKLSAHAQIVFETIL